MPIEREGSADEDLLEDSSNRIEEYLHEQGYRDATAPHTRKQTGDELVVTFDVHRGALYRIDRLEITGAVSIPLSEFQPAMRLHEGAPYAASNQDADRALIEGMYRLRGFTAVRTGVEIESEYVRGGSQAGVIVRLAITEGPRALVGMVRIMGNMSVPEATLRCQASALQPGAPYSTRSFRETTATPSSRCTPISATATRRSRSSPASTPIARRRIRSSPSARDRASSWTTS